MEESTVFPAEVDKVEPDKAIETAESPAQLKSSKDFSPEERATIITKAKEVGFEKVADEFGIKAHLISYWIQQEKKRAAKQSKPLNQSKQLKGTAARAKGSKLDRKVVEHMAEDAETMQTEPIELVIADKPAGRKAERTVSAKVQERSDEKQTEQSLIIENAILKERIALLNREIEKLRAALTNLM